MLQIREVTTTRMRQRQQELDNGVHQCVATSSGPLPSGGPLY
jgi:hypothetical protein